MGNVACCAAPPNTTYSDKDGFPQTIKAQDDSMHGAGVKTGKQVSVEDELAAAAPPPPAAAPAEEIPSEMILNLLDPEHGPAAGLPYQPHFLGPPQPPCEEKRLATIRALETLDQPPDPEIGSILKTVASIFKSPAALVAKFEDKRVYISDSEGALPRGDFPWRWTLCAWSMAYKNPQVLVIPDTMQDARFRHNEKVTSGPRVRFYCGAPLVASNGHRLGTICFLDVKPREFDAASAFILNNFAELVVRRLEKDVVMRLAEKQNEELAQVYGGLQRAIDTVDTCVILVDTEVKGWNIVYSNAAFSNTTGLPREAFMEKPLKDVIIGARESEVLPLASHVTSVGKCASFAVDNVRFKGATTKSAFTLNWRPACRALDDAMMAVGVPSFLRLQGSPGDEGSVSPARYYFVTVELAKEGGRSINSYTSSMSSNSSVDGLQMAHLLGKGAFGSVYAATWYNAPVAVKIIEQELKPLCPGVASLEAILGAELRHPHVVSTLHYTTRKIPMGSVNDSAKDVHSQQNSLHSSAMVSNSGRNEDAHSSAGKIWAVIDAQPDSTLVEDGPETTHDNVTPSDGTAVSAPLDTEDTDAAGEAADRVAPLVGSPNSPVDSGAAFVPESDNSGWSYTAKMGNAQQLQVHGSSKDKDKAAVVTSATGSAASNTSSLGTQTMIILEYCDKGCLQEAIDRGWLRTTCSSLYGGVNLEAVLATAKEMASALSFLHSHRIVHGDLSAWNVMLSSSNSSLGTRGFVAKIADFGLARNLHDTSRILTNTYGTLTHMPPETLNDGVISFAMDVYSYGVLLWQMYTGSRPWSGLRFPQIVMLVGQQHKQLQFLPDAHPGFVKLAHDCMAADPKMRPTFDEVLDRIRDLMDSLNEEPEVEHTRH